jgi:hypothetical protein
VGGDNEEIVLKNRSFDKKIRIPLAKKRDS